MGDRLSKDSQAKITKMLLVFFAVLFAAILIHPEWDLPEVHDVKITSTRYQSQCPAERPLQPVVICATHRLVDVPLLIELPALVPVVAPAGNEPLLTVLRV